MDVPMNIFWEIVNFIFKGAGSLIIIEPFHSLILFWEDLNRFVSGYELGFDINVYLPEKFRLVFVIVKNINHSCNFYLILPIY